jgi:hypothetical protein
MAASNGYSKVYKNRRFEDYRSMKQYYSDRTINEFVVQGVQTTTNTAAEVTFTTGDTINYIAAEGQAYIRTEADDGNQDSKYVYLEYQDDTGLILDPVTADLAAPDNTVETAIGSTDFYRVRQMSCEVESATGGGKAVLLTDANMGGADDVFGFIDDNESEMAVTRYFVPSATQVEHAYIGRIKCEAPYLLEGDATEGGYFLTVAYTPKPLNLGEVAATANRSIILHFSQYLDWQPLIELQPATEVTLSIHKLVDADHPEIYIDATYLEVWVRNSSPSS